MKIPVKFEGVLEIPGLELPPVEPPPIEPPIEPPPIEPPEPGVPAPENLSIELLGATNGIVHWEYEGEAVLFRMSGGGGDLDVTVPIPGRKRSQIITGLPGETTIEVRLAAVTADGVSADAVTTVETGEATEPPPVEPPPVDGETDMGQLVALGGTYIDFETGVDGTPIETAVPRINGATDGTISTEFAYSGTRSFNTYILPGDGGYGNYGGFLGEIDPKPPRMLRGGEVWCRWYAYHPENWKNECSPHMKYMRIETCKRDGDNTGGYADWYIDGNPGRQKWISETQDSGWTWAPTLFDIRKNVWQCHEMYIKLDNIGADYGGMGRAVMWVNGVRVVDTGHSSTLRDARGWSGRIMWRTWHQTGNGDGGGATKRRDSHIDDWALAFRGPSKDHGQLDCTSAMITQGDLPMIGMAKG